MGHTVAMLRLSLSPRWGLCCCRSEPTAHAVGYWLALLRSYSSAQNAEQTSDAPNKFAGVLT
jgi:hypothetical protein